VVPIPANQTLYDSKQLALQLASGVETTNSTTANQLLSSKTFVITGTLPVLKRDEAKAFKNWR